MSIASIAQSSGNTGGILNANAATLPTAIPSTAPITPPIWQIITASLMNCVRMFRFLAPTARRTPISREIGRASCRERVEISVVGGSLKKKKKNHGERRDKGRGGVTRGREEEAR